MVPDLLTTAEVAERLDIDRSTITRWVQLGHVTPAARLPNGALLWTPEQLDQFPAPARKNKAAS